MPQMCVGEHRYSFFVCLISFEYGSFLRLFMLRRIRWDRHGQIDSDKYPSLTSRFAVAGLPTLILFTDGKEYQRIEGVLPGDQLVSQLRYWLHESSGEAQIGGGPSQGNACAPPRDACAPPPDVCSPPPRDACAPSPPQE